MMDGKVVVVTGALGALGKVVAETALARGARVAGVDHATSQSPATATRMAISKARFAPEFIKLFPAAICPTTPRASG